MVFRAIKALVIPKTISNSLLKLNIIMVRHIVMVNHSMEQHIKLMEMHNSSRDISDL